MYSFIVIILLLLCTTISCGCFLNISRSFFFFRYFSWLCRLPRFSVCAFDLHVPVAANVPILWLAALRCVLELLRIQMYVISDGLLSADTVVLHLSYKRSLVMAALCNRAGHFIFCTVVSSIFFSSPNITQPSQIGCLLYFHTRCGLSANLRCRSETCCTRLTENAGRKKVAKKLPSGHHRTTLSGCIFATEACIDNRKKAC